MVRGPTSGNGTRSSVYYLDSAGLGSPRPRPRTLDTELDPLVTDMQADGSLAARPGIGGSWRGAGGRWLLWPLRLVLWTALVAVAFRVARRCGRREMARSPPRRTHSEID